MNNKINIELTSWNFLSAEALIYIRKKTLYVLNHAENKHKMLDIFLHSKQILCVSQYELRICKNFLFDFFLLFLNLHLFFFYSATFELFNDLSINY